MIPKIIWSYWDNPNIPDFISKVTNTWNKFCREENGWKIMILNKNTINQYLDKDVDYPCSIWSYIPQHQSDMFGVSLVKKYGGIWMDANIIMTGNIDFILEKEWFSFYDKKDNNAEIFLFATNADNYAINKIHRMLYDTFSYDNKSLLKIKLKEEYNIEDNYLFPQLLIQYLINNDEKVKNIIINNHANQWNTICSLVVYSSKLQINYKKDMILYLNEKYDSIPKNIEEQCLHKLQGSNTIANININLNSWLYILLEENIGYNIPKIVWQTWKDNNIVPEVQNNINKMKKINPEYDFRLVTDIECDKFIKENFNNQIYQAYLNINPKYGAAKADFWRYCVLYINGGIYLDLDSFIEEKLSNIIKDRDEALISLEMWNFPVEKEWHSSFSDSDKIQKLLEYDNEKINEYLNYFGETKQLAQNILIYRPNHPFLLDVINTVVSNINKWKQIEPNHKIESSISKTIHITGPSAYTYAIIKCIYENKRKYNYRIIDNNNVQFRISEEFTNNMYKNNINNYKNMNNEPFITNNSNTEEEIPKIIWQTYNDIESIPQKVYDNIKKYGKNYQHNIMNDNQCKQILAVFGKEYVNAFDMLKLGCHKADLFRYACLYLFGGVYIDIKIELLKHIDEIIIHKDHFYTFLCQNGIFNGFIACPPKKDIFISLMKTMVNFSKSSQSDYFITVKDFYNKISEYMKKSLTPCVCPGLYKHLKLTIFYNNTIRNNSNKEETDRYGLVCKGHSHNGEIIFNTRYNDFPWKNSSNIVTFTSENLKVSLYKNDCYIANSFQRNIYWDIDTLRRLKEYINPTKNILEIGGHCGTSTLIYSKYLDSDSKIFVYEPQKNMYKLLQKNIKQNNLQEKIIPYNNCVFCEEIEIEMNGTDLDGNIGANIKDMYESSKPCNFGGTCIGKGGEKVKAVVLDKLDHENIGFIHCDAQGAENFIFYGGKEFIKKHRPIIFYENNCKYSESRYLYDNICKYYSDYEEESKFSLEEYCMKELGYTKIIDRFSGVDDLLVP